MLRLAVFAVLGFVLMACQSTVPSTPRMGKSDYAPIYFENLAATPAERMRCEAVGGIVGEGGILRADICYQTMIDAGKVCRDSDDCLSECMAVGDVEVGTKTIGQCSQVDSNFGCQGRVENGRAEPILCVD